MTQPSTISGWMLHPDELSAENRQEISSIVAQYPYFTTGRHLEAAVQHAASAYAPQMLQSMRLYTGNWLSFYALLQRTEGIKPMPKTARTITDNIIPEQSTEEQKDMTGNHRYEPTSKEQLIQPIYTEDYFLHQGIAVDEHIPAELDHMDKEKSLMRMMSFSEWLQHFKTQNQKEKEEEEDKKALKSMWQKEKLAAAMEEENDDIPDDVFEMAVNSITKEEGLISESLAEILIKQGKYDKAIDMYRKLSLRNPQKNTYFAQKIDAVLKEKKS
ncbi:hypothetical protein ACTHGU_04100 [Chitinophagaceae bacterium MMS25-I14]